MKKTLISLALAITGLISQGFAQTLTLKNTTSCSSVTFVVYAHDCSTCTPYSSSCSLVSNMIYIGIGGSMTFNDVTYLNSSPGWAGSYTAIGGSTSGWDYIEYGVGELTTCHNFLGSTSCVSTSTSTFLLSCPCTQWHAIWQTDMSGNITVNVTDWN